MLRIGAIVPGEDIDIASISIHYAETCKRCGWKYHHDDRYPREPKCQPWYKEPPRVPEWCEECQDILFDREEVKVWESKFKQRDMVKMFGWKFWVTNTTSPATLRPMVLIRLYKKLFNPERPDAVLSASWFETSENRDEKNSIKESCAWLIAHWWEHALDICPCQNGVHDDAKGSRFRQHVIDSLLWYHNQGLS